MSGLFGLFTKRKRSEAVAKQEAVDVEEIKTLEMQRQSCATYLENPLPLPKKHEKRTMDFAVEGKVDDFDIPIAPNDDFDV